MNTISLIITLLLTVAFWRQVMALLGAAIVVLVVLGVVFVFENLSLG